MDNNKIELTPFLFDLFKNHVALQENVKRNLSNDLKVLFESKGLKMPNDFSFELKDNALFYTVKEDAMKQPIVEYGKNHTRWPNKRKQ